MNIPILLTSSVVAHDSGVALNDTEARIELTLASVHEWLKQNPTLRIVICDGSNFDFSPETKRRFPQAAIECLHFENNQELVRLHGRGYGEGEIVRHAVNHAKFIAEAGCFAKCSAKLWVENFAECAATWNGRMRFKGVFLDVFSPVKSSRFAYIDTRFYMVSTQDYAQYFLNAHHRIRKDEGHGLEECFRDVFLEHKLQGAMLPVAPMILGVGGGTGAQYRLPLHRRLKEKLRLWLARKNAHYRFMF